MPIAFMHHTGQIEVQCSRNVNQIILSLLAEGHIQFSQGQRPLEQSEHKNSFDLQMFLRLKLLYRTKPE
jgi:hypothetical protein